MNISQQHESDIYSRKPAHRTSKHQNSIATVISTHSTSNSLETIEETIRKRNLKTEESPSIKKFRTQDCEFIRSEKKPEKSVLFNDLDEIKIRLEEETSRLDSQKEAILKILEKINKKYKSLEIDKNEINRMKDVIREREAKLLDEKLSLRHERIKLNEERNNYNAMMQSLINEFHDVKLEKYRMYVHKSINENKKKILGKRSKIFHGIKTEEKAQHQETLNLFSPNFKQRLSRNDSNSSDVEEEATQLSRNVLLLEVKPNFFLQDYQESILSGRVNPVAPDDEDFSPSFDDPDT
ncbi:unnamed protein product [Blepharisma stoltei]|uniref:Uncharacterized protein n=1 Tax=Blepharisma stoltei TaxID=1481888 RepID=A0AAU9JAX1_9CILI|nr:unnamed protein product [Blepharisma stoltei]